jgi:FMN phosphatase YigB (HAD superfamily)
MKKILAALCLIPSLLFGLVFESSRMDDILPHVEEETWVLIDVDNTLIESSVHLGSAQWREHIRKKARKAGYDKKGVEEVLDRFWLFVQPFVPVRLVDQNALQIIRSLQTEKTAVVALTARDPYELEHTRKQLQSTGIYLSNPDFPKRAAFLTPAYGLYEDGVIYCGDNTKSEALLAFFNYVGKTPKKVIFVDDKSSQVEDLQETLEAMGVEFVGIHFRGAESRVKAFDGDVADLQFSHLPSIISDEEAKQLLSRR